MFFDCFVRYTFISEGRLQHKTFNVTVDNSLKQLQQIWFSIQAIGKQYKKCRKEKNKKRLPAFYCPRTRIVRLHGTMYPTSEECPRYSFTQNLAVNIPMAYR